MMSSTEYHDSKYGLFAFEHHAWNANASHSVGGFQDVQLSVFANEIDAVHITLLTTFESTWDDLAPQFAKRLVEESEVAEDWDEEIEVTDIRNHAVLCAVAVTDKKIINASFNVAWDAHQLIYAVDGNKILGLV